MKSKSSHLLKLLALLPIIGTALALNARTVTDYVYDEPQRQVPVKKGKRNTTIKTGPGQIIQIIETESTNNETDQAYDVEKFVMKGKVIDREDGSAIVGAVVNIQGSKQGTVTDRDGNFSLEVSVGDRIEVTYAGYDTFSTGVSKAYAKDRTYMIALYKEGTTPNKVFDVVENMPQYPGGIGALMEFLSRNVRYPKEAEQAGTQGRVIATFVVEEDGSISGAQIVKSVDPLLDEEALRVVNSMPNWESGTQNGEPVRVKYTIPITFRLDNGSPIPALKEKSANQINETVAIGHQEEGTRAAYMAGYAAGKNGIDPEKTEIRIDGKVVSVNELGKLNPKDIEHMDVLKNKASLEKLNVKGKDAVIIIVTKKKK